MSRTHKLPMQWSAAARRSSFPSSSSRIRVRLAGGNSSMPGERHSGRRGGIAEQGRTWGGMARHGFPQNRVCDRATNEFVERSCEERRSQSRGLVTTTSANETSFPHRTTYRTGASYADRHATAGSCCARPLWQPQPEKPQCPVTVLTPLLRTKDQESPARRPVTRRCDCRRDPSMRGITRRGDSVAPGAVAAIARLGATWRLRLSCCRC